MTLRGIQISGWPAWQPPPALGKDEQAERLQRASPRAAKYRTEPLL
jgi:hypothetical protein